MIDIYFSKISYSALKRFKNYFLAVIGRRLLGWKAKKVRKIKLVFFQNALNVGKVIYCPFHIKRMFLKNGSAPNAGILLKKEKEFNFIFS